MPEAVLDGINKSRYVQADYTVDEKPSKNKNALTDKIVTSVAVGIFVTLAVVCFAAGSVFLATGMLVPGTALMAVGSLFVVFLFISLGSGGSISKIDTEKKEV
ncbi:hypothetical protein PHSC3_000740 [Chlamydiales bacterium STE3]|nr:hypothetical protein PHSC3_000740 [Chlamydiales bacterium STE3]